MGHSEQTDSGGRQGHSFYTLFMMVLVLYVGAAFKALFESQRARALWGWGVLVFSLLVFAHYLRQWGRERLPLPLRLLELLTFAALLVLISDLPLEHAFLDGARRHFASPLILILSSFGFMVRFKRYPGSGGGGRQKSQLDLVMEQWDQQEKPQGKPQERLKEEKTDA